MLHWQQSVQKRSQSWSNYVIFFFAVFSFRASMLWWQKSARCSSLSTQSASELLICYQEILHYMPDAACLLRPCCVRLNLFRSFTKYCACTYFNLVILISTQIFKRLAVHCHQICQQWHIHFLETVSGKIYGQICLQRGQVRSQMTRRWLRCWRRVRAPASWCFQGPVVPIFPLRCQFLALSCIREHYTGLFLRRHFHFATTYIFERPVFTVDFFCLMRNEIKYIFDIWYVWLKMH